MVFHGRISFSMRFLALIPILALASCSQVDTLYSSVGDKFSGPNVKVVHVRPEALKALKSGQDKAIAYQSKPRYTASYNAAPSKKWENFTLPESFELPELPTIDDNNPAPEATLLLPPRS